MLLSLGATAVTSSKDILDALHFEGSGEVQSKDHSDCSPDELRLIELLANSLTREELITTFGKPAHETNALISLLELKGHIKESGGELHLV
jgi:predicted Rossmann fold nucleotide-binding protein DprA/Smf involved in DNA uptake